MKKVVIIAKYEVYVPETMSEETVLDEAQQNIEQACDWFNIEDKDEEAYQVSLQDVYAGTSAKIEIGGMIDITFS